MTPSVSAEDGKTGQMVYILVHVLVYIRAQLVSARVQMVYE